MSVRAALQRFAEGGVLGSVTDDRRDAVLIALAEVLNNIAEHAYGGMAGPVTVNLRRGAGAVTVRVLDKGDTAPLFACAEAPDPAHLPEGGFGLPLIRALAEGLVQQRRLGCNVLCLRFSAHSPPEPRGMFPVRLK